MLGVSGLVWGHSEQGITGIIMVLIIRIVNSAEDSWYNQVYCLNC